jgi:hypothetical protein
VGAGNLAQSIQCGIRFAIRNPTVFNEERSMLAAILAFRPAKQVAVCRKFAGSRSTEREAKPLLDLALDPVDSLVVDRVFEARMLTIDPVAIIALYGHDGVDGLRQPCDIDVTDHVGEPWIGFRILIGAAKTAADCNVEPLEFAAFGYRDEAEILNFRGI